MTIFDLNTLAYASRALSPGQDEATVPIERLEVHGLGGVVVVDLDDERYFCFVDPVAVAHWVAGLGALHVTPDGVRGVAVVRW